MNFMFLCKGLICEHDKKLSTSWLSHSNVFEQLQT